ncbi:DNA-repair protein XRCC1 [Aristolochia californica]|uniref:DNA-repair protein XRCC1 n=1 Tax=Aristolochia californica TaxID=171875 RepID=UPI0035DA59EF
MSLASNGRGTVAPSMGTPQFSKLMEGVVFALSGLVNPERSILRSQALNMGAEYKPDWTSDCTLLVCAFPNTPKFRQVEADCGTIVSKEWISECYNRKELVEIDSYLMHAGKPWRRSKIADRVIQDPASSYPEKPPYGAQKKLKQKLTAQAVPVVAASNTAGTHLSPTKVKEWAIDDFNKTILWLKNQEEKPDPTELNSIASEGILTCLQDCIAALDENQDIRSVTEQWKFVPRVVEELAKLEDTRKSSQLISRNELSKQAVVSKSICQRVFDDLLTTTAKSKKLKTNKGVEPCKDKAITMYDDTGSDSDKTIEMTEDEIELACQRFDALK